MEKIDSCGADRFFKEFRILTRKLGATEEKEPAILSGKLGDLHKKYRNLS